MRIVGYCFHSEPELSLALPPLQTFLTHQCEMLKLRLNILKISVMSRHATCELLVSKESLSIRLSPGIASASIIYGEMSVWLNE